MICILSQAFFEGSTESVCDWLRAWNVPFVRLNTDDIECNGALSVRFEEEGIRCLLSLDGTEIDLADVGAVWYRRWRSSRSAHQLAPTVERGQIFAKPDYETRPNILQSYAHITSELKVACDVLFDQLKHAKWLGSPDTAAPNKLIVLNKAKQAGLDIPPTIVTSDPTELMEFSRLHGPVVTKALSDPMMCWAADRIYATYTSPVEGADRLSSRWRGGFPSLFQAQLCKAYEIRTFYLDGVCYSMAMFSQKYAETTVDFRHYRVPVRWVPYALPRDIELRIGLLMNDLRLATGSIDIVRTSDLRYVFLEVNPAGQFGMVSGPCNYNLEREVAHALVSRDEEYQRERKFTRSQCPANDMRELGRGTEGRHA